MIRALLASASLLMMPIAAPASVPGPQAAEKGAPCKASSKKKRGSAMFGSVLGGLASGALGGRASSLTSLVPFNTVATMLTDAIACRLDEKEQKQAAGATDQAVRGGVGSKAAWTSGSRAGVSGTSTVLAQSQSAAGGSCMDVNDVIIVNGEETTVSKRMCRAPGASGYVLAA